MPLSNFDITKQGDKVFMKIVNGLCIAGSDLVFLVFPVFPAYPQ
jgi:hypothetical protein